MNLNDNWVASPDCETKKAKLLIFTNKVLVENNRKFKSNYPEFQQIQAPDEECSCFLIINRDRIQKFNERFAKMVEIYFENNES